MKKVSLQELKNNDVIAEDVLTSRKKVLIAKGTTVDGHVIQALMNAGINEVMIKLEQTVVTTDGKTEYSEEERKAMIKKLRAEMEYKFKFCNSNDVMKRLMRLAIKYRAISMGIDE